MAWVQAGSALAGMAAKRLAASPAVKTAAGGLAQQAVGPATQAVRDKAGKRGYRRTAIDLAWQVQGEYSEEMIVAGKRRYVVWREGAPFACFPPLESDVPVPLSELPELDNVPHSARIAPEARVSKRRRLGRGTERA